MSEAVSLCIYTPLFLSAFSTLYHSPSPLFVSPSLIASFQGHDFILLVSSTSASTTWLTCRNNEAHSKSDPHYHNYYYYYNYYKTETVIRSYQYWLLSMILLNAYFRTVGWRLQFCFYVTNNKKIHFDTVYRRTNHIVYSGEKISLHTSLKPISHWPYDIDLGSLDFSG